jgi:hypothetical protein
MTRVLIVNHDIELADQEADSLRRLGYDIEQCRGPSHARCPVMRGEGCLAVERADVLVYDVWASGEAGGARRLVQNLRAFYPYTPIILTAPGIELDWVETDGPEAVVPLVGVPTGARLDAAIRQALEMVAAA